MEWEKTKWVELQAQSEKEKRDIERLTARKRSLEQELEAVVRLPSYTITHTLSIPPARSDLKSDYLKLVQ